MKVQQFAFGLSVNLLIICVGSTDKTKLNLPELPLTAWLDEFNEVHFIQEEFLKIEYGKFQKQASPMGAKMSPDITSQVAFKLYTRNAPNKCILLEPTYESVNDSTFDTRKETRFMTHGFWSSGDSDTSLSVKNSYLQHQDVNVILVDWKSKADTLNYISAAKNTLPIGQFVGEMLDTLVDYGADPNKIHLIGHSLGAHISGFAGKYSKYKISRITGLDPAGPLFETFKLIGDHLSPDNAHFVDIIHTSAGALGYQSTLGHIDFYPNDGIAPQPGCEQLTYVLGPIARMVDSCSHGRSWEFFSDSINPQQRYLGENCTDFKTYTTGICDGQFQLMGEYVNQSASGKYYLTTNSRPLYARG